MYFSKIWFGLIALAGGFALSLAVLAQVPSQHMVEREQAERLEHAQQSLQLLFKVNARKWMDTAARAASDREIVGPLEEASRAADVASGVHQTARNKLRSFNSDLKLQLLWAVDVKGRVVARAGTDDAQYGDSVIGLPLVEDALRGYRGDDTWALDSRLYRVVATPVLSRGADRYVGALVLGEEVDAKLAFAIKERLRLDVAFLLRDRLLGATFSSAILNDIPALIEKKHAAIVAKAGWTGVVPLDKGRDQLLVAAGPFTGEAHEQRAMWALIARRGAPAGLKTIFAEVTKDDLRPGRFPWFLVVGSLVLAFVVGIFLMRLEVDGPLARFLARAKELARGDLAKVPDATFGGKLGAIARNINTGLEKIARTASPPPPIAAKDLGSILGPPQTHDAFDDVIPHAGASIGDLGLVPPSAAIVDELPGAPTAPPLPPVGTAVRPRTGAQPVPPAPRPVTGSVLPFGGPPPAGPEPPDVFASAPPLPPPLPSGAAGRPGSMAQSAGPPSVDMPQAAGPGAAGAPSEDGELDAYFHKIFDEFVEMKQACGEPTDALTYDKFVLKLRDNRSTLIDKYGCKSVKFQVYIKDGKAALKATPVK